MIIILTPVRVKLTIVLTLAAVVATVATAFAAGGDSATRDRHSVVAAFYPLAFAAEQLAPGANVANLTPPGAEPHDLELSPADVAKLKSAGAVLVLGHGFQPQLERAARAAPRLLDAPGVDRRGNDPHVWLDPVRYAALARAVAAELHADATPLVALLRALDREYRDGLARCTRRDLVTSHAAFGYLAARYRLRQIAVEGLSPDAEPTPKVLARVIDDVRRSDATTVFFERLVSPKLARTIAAETGRRTALLDPIEGVARGDDYFKAMRRNLAALREALGCR
jgi:zinc transport system substrate-binding protein